MRLWTLHPKYLDRPGLLGLWREGLGALAALHGRGGSYTKHPQLERFKACTNPVQALTAYLYRVAEEMRLRGYKPDLSKLPELEAEVRIPVTTGQMQYEAAHLAKKLAARGVDMQRLRELITDTPDSLLLHPVFMEVPGDVEIWEKQTDINR